MPSNQDPDDDIDRNAFELDDGELDPDEELWDDHTSAFVLCARPPYEDWVRQVSGEAADWTLPPMARCHAFLTPELMTQADADEWVQQNYRSLFEGQCDKWTDDESLWPDDRSIETFRQWFDVVFAPTVDDMREDETGEGGERLPREVTCAPLSLRRVLAEFLQLPADGSLHVEVETGELIGWTDGELEAIHAGDAESYGVGADDMRELQEAFASESLIEIAHRADVENGVTMAAFARSLESATLSNRLTSALRGKKARRRFKAAVDIAGLRHRWSAWLEKAAAETLRVFMQSRGVPFVDDVETEEGERPTEE